MRKVKIGVIGCGNICDQYFVNIAKLYRNIEIVACADAFMDKAKEAAEKYGVKTVLTPDELMASEDIEIVLNLTPPKFHHSVCMNALKAGKHVYTEKPISVSLSDAKEIMELAKEKNLMVGVAPDTFLGGAIRTCRKLIDDDFIGEVIAANAMFACHGPESWHPAPDFFYKEGAGPLFDMGPYYIASLTNLVSPIKSVMGSARKSFEQRMITSEPLYGKMIDVEVMTHVSGILNFENGAVGSFTASFDVFGTDTPNHIEIHGTKGSLKVPDPNKFTGKIYIRTALHDDWKEVPEMFEAGGRGFGLSNMAMAITDNEEIRASGELGYHVIEVMHALLESSNEGKLVEIKGKVQRPKAL